jgi:hypothetical protein
MKHIPDMARLIDFAERHHAWQLRMLALCDECMEVNSKGLQARHRKRIAERYDDLMHDFEMLRAEMEFTGLEHEQIH